MQSTFQAKSGLPSAESGALPGLDHATRAPRKPYEWSLARPGAELHVEPGGDHVTGLIELDLMPVADEVLPPRIRTLTVCGAAGNERRAYLLGIAVSAALCIFAVTAFSAAAIRIPEIERQLAAAART